MIVSISLHLDRYVQILQLAVEQGSGGEDVQMPAF